MEQQAVRNAEVAVDPDAKLEVEIGGGPGAGENDIRTATANVSGQPVQPMFVRGVENNARCDRGGEAVEQPDGFDGELVGGGAPGSNGGFDTLDFGAPAGIGADAAREALGVLLGGAWRRGAFAHLDETRNEEGRPPGDRAGVVPEQAVGGREGRGGGARSEGYGGGARRWCGDGGGHGSRHRRRTTAACPLTLGQRWRTNASGTRCGRTGAGGSPRRGNGRVGQRACSRSGARASTAQPTIRFGARCARLGCAPLGRRSPTPSVRC